MNNKFKKLIKISEQAGKIQLKYFGKILKIEEKGIPADFRTKADLESEKYIIKEIEKIFPNYNILSEERGFIDKHSDYTFIIDPLDGTNNFVLGIPIFLLNIALNKNNKTIFTLIHIPILKDTYWAEKGKGAYLNNKKICVNKEKEIKKATISYIQGYKYSKKYYLNLLKNLEKLNIKRLLKTWSAIDYCLLASGKIESVITNKSEIYDYIAGKLLAKEAGAIVSDFKGKKEKDERNDKFIASNNKIIHKEILKII
jgi:myo-inositol-1(or 4)-monophosphatase